MKSKRFWFRLASVIALVHLLLPLGGCWDLRYLDKLGVVLALGIDEDPKGRQGFQLTVQVVLPQNVAGGQSGVSSGETTVMTFTETGDTMFEAIRKMSSKTSRFLFYSHTQLLVISEPIARKGIFPYLDLMERNPEIRTDVAVLIARGSTAKQVLQTTTQMESIPTNQIFGMIDVNERGNGSNYQVTVQDIIQTIGRQQAQIAVPSIMIEGDEQAGNSQKNIGSIKPEAIPKLVTMGVFRDGRLTGFLKMRESQGLTWAMNKMRDTIVKQRCPNGNGYLTAEIRHAQTKIRVGKQRKQGETLPFLSLVIEMNGYINEVMCPGLDITDQRQLKEIGKLVDKNVEAAVRQTINRLQKELRTDVLGWGNQVYIQQPGIWREIGGEWPDIFPTVPYEVSVRTNIVGTGVRSNSIVK